MSTRTSTSANIFCILFVVIASYFTYMHNFGSPADLFWDENYHIASAQKYLHGVYFMEPHPPLGKMMIALGEYVLHPNEASNQFLTTDYGRNIPGGFSFVGYRFFPTLLAWLAAPLFFFICFKITKDNISALLLSSLYIFDNALIVHQRSAMLESTLIFFSLLMIFCWLILLEKRNNKQSLWPIALACGACFGAVLGTKANGLIMILLWPMLMIGLYPHWKRIVEATLAFIGGFLLVYCSIWYAHFAIGSTIQPELPDKGYYQASNAYKEYLDAGTTKNPLHFPLMLADSWNFLDHYSRGVPKLDLCKADENGSPWFYWPFGGRSINYRWRTQAGSESYQYLYLQANPITWGLGLVGLIGAASLLFAYTFLPVNGRLKQPLLLLTFSGMYVSYMIIMSRLDRVMYLYHYFIPLLFSYILFVLVINEIKQLGSFTLQTFHKQIVLLVLSCLILASYEWYRPFSYYEPVSDQGVEQRAFLPIWDLKCVRCEQERYLHPQTCS